MIDPDQREMLSRLDSATGGRLREARTDDSAGRELRALASRYRQASGVAYTAGNDAGAAKFREAAAKLNDLAAELPPLPVVTR